MSRTKRNSKRAVVDAAHAPHVATSRTRGMVERLASYGLSPAQIAFALDTDPATVLSVYQQELEHGESRVTAQVADALVKQAKRGDVNAARFYLQARAGWVPATKVQHTGKVEVDAKERQELVNAIVALATGSARPPAPVAASAPVSADAQQKH